MTSSNRLSKPHETSDVLVIGAGPAGAMAALRAADLGARTTLVTSGKFGGMAANHGPVPVRTLARAASLISGSRRLNEYGINVGEPALDYQALLARVRSVVDDVVAHSSMREQLDALNVTIIEDAGSTRFIDPHTVAIGSGQRLSADKIILCVGSVARELPIRGFELTKDHSSALGADGVPESMLIIGGGATAVQIASIFSAFGSRVQIFEKGPRILSTEDEDVSRAMAAAFREADVVIRENFGTIESFEQTSGGTRMNFRTDGGLESAEAEVVIAATGRVADTRGLNLAAAGILSDARGFVAVDEYLQTSTQHIFAAGDVTGRSMIVPAAVQDGFCAATNAVLGSCETQVDRIDVTASFTHPEYARSGLTEAEARRLHDVLTATVRFDSTMRTIIDGRTHGFCKLVVDRGTAKILGCHCVGELAGEIAQAAAVAISSGMRVDELVRVPLAFPTYVGNLAYAAADAARQLELQVDGKHVAVGRHLSATGPSKDQSAIGVAAE